MRELGYTDMVEPKRVSRGLSGAGQKRCQWEGGYCNAFTAGRYCLEHEQRGEITSAYRRAA
jgi:hypothetical protein